MITLDSRKATSRTSMAAAANDQREFNSMKAQKTDSNLEDALENWASMIRVGTEKRIAQSILFSVVTVSGISTQFSGWLLAICGATIGLAFSNLDSLVSFAKPSPIKAALLFLILSSFAGFIARIFGSYIELYRQIIIETDQRIKEVLEQHEKKAEEFKNTAGEDASVVDLYPNIEKAVSVALSCAPRAVRWWAGRGTKAGGADPFKVYKKAMKCILMQSFMIFFQVVFFGVFAFLVLFSL